MIDLPEGTSSSCLLLEMKHRDGESPANDGFNSYGANVAPWKKWDVIVFFYWGWILLYESANQWKKDRKRDICPFSVLQSFTGWWYTYPSEKYEFVSWNDDIPNIWEVIKLMFQTTNQLAIILFSPIFLCASP